NHPVKAYSIELRGSKTKRLMLYWPTKPIQPGESTTNARPSRVDLSGEPAGYTARVAGGVVFPRAPPWGGVFPPPPPPAPHPPPAPPAAPPDSNDNVVVAGEPPSSIHKSGGGLMGSAIHRVPPSYPAQAKAEDVSGSVVVEVTIDEEGIVIAARALSGHP